MFRAYLAALRFERRCPKPNTVARLKSKYLTTPKNWVGYATVRWSAPNVICCGVVSGVNPGGGRPTPKTYESNVRSFFPFKVRPYRHPLFVTAVSRSILNLSYSSFNPL